MAKEMTIEELKLKLAEAVEAQTQVEQELETARETTQKLLEKNAKLQQINTDLFARTVAGQVEANDTKKPKSFDDAIDNIVKSVKKK
jgi:regulator of replication initiation timing